MKKLIFFTFLMMSLVGRVEGIGLNTNVSERLNKGNTIQIYKNPTLPNYTSYICRKIQNTSVTNDVFIPLKTEIEFQAFLSNSPGYLLKSVCEITTNCTPKPSNSTEYTAINISQTSGDGVTWLPSNVSYHSNTSTTTTCAYRCNPGHFYNGAGCPSTSPGYYAPGYGNTSQIACTPGNYQPNYTQTSCISASPGYYVPSSAQANQTACSAGSYQASGGQSSCNLASPGYYVSSTAQTGQSACGGNNVYCPGSGNTGPTGVTTGYYSTGGGSTTRTGQSICEPGNSCNGGVKTACPAGYYQPNSGQTSCIAASPGYYVPGSGASSQTACNAGSYQPNSGQTSCISASPGYYVPSSARSYQTACPAGYYQPSGGQTGCSPAGTGYYVPGTGSTGQTACTNKPSNSSYTSSSGLTSNSCPWSCNGNYHLEGGVCQYDYQSQVVACSAKPSNSYWNAVSSITQNRNWNGSGRTGWSPTTSTTYSSSSSSTYCQYGCNSGYQNSGASCVPQNCGSTSMGGYSVSSMLHGGTTSSSRSYGIANGTMNCNQGFSCAYGTTGTYGGESCTPSCNSGYYASGGSCLPYTYTLSYGGWGACSASPTWSGWGTCSGGTQSRTCMNTSGTQTRSASCIRNQDGASVSMSYCGTPTTTQSCTSSCSGSSTQSCTMCPSYSKTRTFANSNVVTLTLPSTPVGSTKSDWGGTSPSTNGCKGAGISHLECSLKGTCQPGGTWNITVNFCNCLAD